ncbi:MAG: type 2 lanthipeptide synthetase LanM family protein [Lachnotalea sp.]
MNNVKQLNISMKSFIYTLTIKERLCAFNDKHFIPIEDTTILDDNWLNTKSLVSPKVFIEELEHIEVKKEELAYALKTFTDDEENILIEYLDKQDWFTVYKNLMLEFEEFYADETVICEQLVLPFKLFVKKEIYNMEMNLENIKIGVDLIEKLCESIVHQLSKLTWKCLIVEISDYKKQNILKGIDGEEKYLSFLDICYKSPLQIQSFYNKYPVLNRLITQKMLDLLTSLNDMLTNIDIDFIEIDNLFKIGTNIIKDIKMSLGDTHQHGKSVSEIVFNNNKNYMYKPRNSYIGQAFDKMIEFINRNSDLKDLFINTVYYTKTFTIEQFIEAQSCKTIEEVKDYYYRFGMITLLVSLLNGSDMHFENIIAHNHYPCIIDFETLFTQFYFLHNESDANIKVLDNQVFNLNETGLLPRSFRLDNKSDEIDVSALAGGISQSISKKVLVAKNVYTDNMCFEYENSYILKQNKNRPTLNGKFEEFKNYKQDIYDGFNATLEWVFKNVSEVKYFIKETFNNLLVRQVMKDTALYSNLITYMDHPHYLKDMVKIEKLLENNWAYSYNDKRLVKYEIMDMIHLEIPIFYTNTSQTYLKTSNGNYINNYFKKDVLSKTISTISSLTREMIQKEKTKLCLLLGDYKVLANDNKKNLIKEKIKSNLRIYQNEEVLQTCNDIAENMMKAAITDKKSISWEHVDNSMELSKFTYLNNGLYSGRSGILLYIFYLNNKQKNESMSTFTNNLMQATKFYKEPIETTVFKGAAGSLYSLLKCDTSYSNLKIVQDTIITISNNSIEMKKIDWLDGGASLIKLIYNINQTKYKSNLSLEVTNKIMESICNSLKNQSFETYKLGFGHGAMGLLYALLVGQSLLKKNYNAEIEKILDLFEDKLKYLNIKRITEVSKNPLSWGDGIVGLGIGALACKKYMEDYRLDNYINLTFEVIKNYSFDDMSLCNGLAGELDFLASLLLSKDDPLIYQLIVKKRNQIIDFYKINGTALIDELPQFRNYGLFGGLSGVGYSMLRSLYPAEIPSVLVLD